MKRVFYIQKKKINIYYAETVYAQISIYYRIRYVFYEGLGET